LFEVVKCTYRSNIGDLRNFRNGALYQHRSRNDTFRTKVALHQEIALLVVFVDNVGHVQNSKYPIQAHAHDRLAIRTCGKHRPHSLHRSIVYTPNIEQLRKAPPESVSHEDVGGRACKLFRNSNVQLSKAILYGCTSFQSGGLIGRKLSLQLLLDRCSNAKNTPTLQSALDAAAERANKEAYGLQCTRSTTHAKSAICLWEGIALHRKRL
jgi:hypothetical protein